ncbi:MAG TPA: DUF2332 domain-containing protein [Solirubrobacteraceae bacterium]|nr:DUF2332 domain-containing protein [Solirubrobacteraceae bacterium]
MSAQAKIAERLRWQADACARVGSPLYARLLEHTASDVEASGPCLDVLAAHARDDPRSMLPLRLMGAVHRLVLEGRAPALARAYADPAADDPWPAFREVVAGHRDELRAGVRRGVQTNEVMRCAALLGGFLLVARETGLPLRALEVGASAGLNLRWDAYGYASDGRAWGDLGSPVRLGYAPPVDTAATVVQRRGCDPNPVDPATDDGRLTLLSYVWPDQRWRFELLEAALDVAARVPATVDRIAAAAWLRDQLAAPAAGRATVAFHSIVMQYLPAAEREEVLALLAVAGERATAEAPVAWLRMEPETADRAGVWLDLWGPRHRHARIAAAGYHGRPVEWEGW